MPESAPAAGVASVGNQTSAPAPRQQVRLLMLAWDKRRDAHISPTKRAHIFLGWTMPSAERSESQRLCVDSKRRWPPRHHRRGLIEARKLASSKCCTTALERHRCRGLIEARIAQSIAVSCGGPSAASPPRPIRQRCANLRTSHIFLPGSHARLDRLVDGLAAFGPVLEGSEVVDLAVAHLLEHLARQRRAPT